ncbi:MAG: putative lipid II flippase FtsW [Chloroflexi bacterium]|nr:putative lipid II flippase FtsW [Chloroflexota bacterium]
MSEQYRPPDYLLLVAVLALVILGLDMVYSASFVIAHNSPLYRSDTYFLTRQLGWAALGTVALLVTLRIDYHWWQRWSVPLVIVVLLMLVAVVVTNLGHAAYGAQRWLRLGPLPPVQPSEFAKLALILYYADWLSRRRGRLGDFTQGAFPFGITLAVVSALLMLQPDMGSTLVIVMTAFAVVFIAGAPIRHLLLGVVVGLAGMGVLALTAGYRLRRILTFLSPDVDPQGGGWHVLQASIALGSGGVFGLGLGASRQKFYYLPSAHTDAIFAVIGEELGFIGAVATLALVALIAYRGYRIVVHAPDTVGALIATGITSWLTFQALLNVAVITATVPFTGIPFPFVSFGGSSLVPSMASVGILLNISRHRKAFQPERNRFRGAEPRPVVEYP